MAKVDGVTSTETVFKSAEELDEAAGGNVFIPQPDSVDRLSEPNGTTVVYDQRTGEASIIRLWEGRKTLDAYLKKKDTEGNYVFGTRSPKGNTKVIPSLPCWLSKTSDKFNYFRQIGLVTGNGCTKILFNETDVRNHMENTHPSEYAYFTRESADVDKNALQAALLAALNK